MEGAGRSRDLARPHGDAGCLAHHAPLVALDLKAEAIAAAAPADDAERQFIARGRTAAYEDVITSRTRLLREGQYPIDGTAAIGEYLKSQDGQWPPGLGGIEKIERSRDGCFPGQDLTASYNLVTRSMTSRMLSQALVTCSNSMVDNLLTLSRSMA